MKKQSKTTKKRKKMIKTHLRETKEKLKASEKANRRLHLLKSIVGKDLKFLTKKITLLEVQLHRLKKKRTIILGNKEYVEKSLRKIKKTISKRRKLSRELKTKKI